MKPKGAGMEMTDSRQFLWGVAATDVEYSWDGKVFISDFVTGWKSHEDGRLLSLSAGEKTWRAAEAASAAAIIREGFDQRGSTELQGLLSHPDARVRLRAQVALTRKPDALNCFIETTESPNLMDRVHGIWGLGILARQGSVPTPFGKPTTSRPQNPALPRSPGWSPCSPTKTRKSAPRPSAFLPIPRAVPPTFLSSRFSPTSRRASVSSPPSLAGKLKQADCFVPICEMLAENNNRDVYLRHAGIFALQHIAASPAILSALATTYDSAAVRLAAVVALRRMGDPGVSAFIRDADPKVADEAIRAICDMDMVSQRPAVAALLDDLSSRAWSPFMLRRLIHNAFRIGTPENAARILKLAADPQIPESVRQEAFRLLAIWTEPHPVDQLTGHWHPLEKRDPGDPPPRSRRRAARTSSASRDSCSPPPSASSANTTSKSTAWTTAPLEILVNNPKLPAKARATALDLLIEQKPAKPRSDPRKSRRRSVRRGRPHRPGRHRQALARKPPCPRSKPP